MDRSRRDVANVNPLAKIASYLCNSVYNFWATEGAPDG